MKVRIAMLSFWHVHAPGYARQLAARTDCEIVAVWDESPERGRQMADQLKVPFVADVQSVLDNPEVDAVVVSAPTSMHPELLIAAAEAGKHLFTEKSLALGSEDAERIAAAARRHGVKLTVSLPRLFDANGSYAKTVLEQGLLGKLTFVRSRYAHDGALPRDNAPNGWLPAHFFDKAQSGGGALIDLGCHPMALLAHLLGMPKTVSSRFGYVTGREVEDNAVVSLGYEDGTLAIVEASFVSRQSPTLLELYGTEGCLILGGQPQLRSALLAAGSTPGTFSPDRLPAGLPTPLDQWLDHLVYDRPPAVTVEHALALTRLMEAAYVSAGEQRVVELS